MIYVKRILWLLGYPIMWLLACIIFIISLFVIVFMCIFLYIKNGNIEGCNDYLEWCYKLIEWYNNIEPKENLNKIEEIIK